MPEIIEQIGAYAGFAAVIGLAVLSALYFSQARDVKRLREWAGRAPEREPAERAAAQARAQAAAQQRPQPPPAQQQPAPQQGKPAPASQAGATATASPPKPGAPKPGAKPAGANGGPAVPPRGPGGPAVSGRPGAPGKAPPAAPPRVPAAQQTAVLPAAAVPRPPWYRRLGLPAPRYLVIALAGVLILGGGAAFGISQLGSEDTAAPPAGQAQGGAGAEPANATPTPSDITVSVLNGTTVTGLASQYRDALEEAGYDVGNAANFVDQAKAESAVLFADGARESARVVADDLEISQIEPVDGESQRLGGNASVIVILGADKTP